MGITERNWNIYDHSVFLCCIILLNIDFLRVYEVIWIRHDGDVDYVLSVDRITRSKHARPLEDQFTGIFLLDNTQHTDTETDVSSDREDRSYASFSLDGDLDTANIIIVTRQGERVI